MSLGFGGRRDTDIEIYDILWMWWPACWRQNADDHRRHHRRVLTLDYNTY